MTSEGMMAFVAGVVSGVVLAKGMALMDAATRWLREWALRETTRRSREKGAKVEASFNPLAARAAPQQEAPVEQEPKWMTELRDAKKRKSGIAAANLPEPGDPYGV